MSWTSKINSLVSGSQGTGILGIHVSRAAADMGATAVRIPLFTIAGGEILLTCLYGVCTVAETGAANAIQFDATATVGNVFSPMDDGVGDINGILVGGMIAPQGDITLPAVVAGPFTGNPTFSMPFICKVGTIGITKAAATDAGTWRFEAYYIPLISGAVVTAA